MWTIACVVITYHNDRFKHLDSQYIYLISYRNAKKANPMRWICLFLKRYRPDTLSLFYVCADNSGHLHHVDRLAFFQICKVSDLA